VNSEFGILNSQSPALFDKTPPRSSPEDLDRPVHDGLRHAGDTVLPHEIRKLDGAHRGGRHEVALERHSVRQADRPGTLRSRRRREHLDVERRPTLRQQGPARGRQARVSARHEQDRVDERHDLVPAGAPTNRMPRSRSPTTAIAGARSMRYAAAASRSIRRSRVSIVRRSVSDASSRTSPATGRTPRPRPPA